MLPKECPALHFNPFDPDYVRDPLVYLNRFRDEASVYFWEAGGGPVFFRWRECSALLREPRLGHDPTFGAGFPPEMKAAFPDYVALRENDFLFMPPETHTRTRRMLNPIFGPRALERYRPQIKRIIDKLLERMPVDGEINVFEDYARQYPVRVIASILNIPEGHEADFVAFADALISTIFPGLPPEVFASFMPAISRGVTIVRECIAERRNNPKEDDLLTQLIQACDEEHRFTEGELLSLVGSLIVGGSDTTTHLTTATFLQLLRHPDQLAILRQDPSLSSNTLDETLRYIHFGRTFLPRFIKETFDFEGVTLEQGKIVYLSLISAFHDKEYTPDADVYDIRRRHVGSPWFGHGPHFCLGASLARLEAEMALQMFLDRYPSIELAGEPTYGMNPILRDMVNLPLRVRGSV